MKEWRWSLWEPALLASLYGQVHPVPSWRKKKVRSHSHLTLTTMCPFTSVLIDLRVRILTPHLLYGIGEDFRQAYSAHPQERRSFKPKSRIDLLSSWKKKHFSTTRALQRHGNEQSPKRCRTFNRTNLSLHPIPIITASKRVWSGQ